VDLIGEAGQTAYLNEMSNRVARKLVFLPFLNYDHATDEDNLTVLMLSMIQAGFRPLATLNEHYEFFEKMAPLPMMLAAHVPPPGKERKTRPLGKALAALPSGWMRVGPYAKQLEDLSTSRVDDVANAFKVLSENDQRRVLLGMGVPTEMSAAPIEPPIVPSTGSAGLPSDFGTQMAMGLAPMLQQLQASVAAVTSAVKKRSKDDSEDSDSEEEDEARLQKLCMFGGLQLAKNKKMKLEDFHRENEVEKIRAAQRIRKLPGSGKWDLLWNQSVDEQTVLLVQLEKIRHEKLKGKISTTTHFTCDTYERTLHTQLMGIKEKLEVLGECVSLMTGVKGGNEEAEAVFALYNEKLSGTSESKFLSKLRTEAKAKLKWRKEMSMLEAVAQMGSGKGGRRPQNYDLTPPPSRDQGKGNQGRGKGDGKGKGGPQEFVMKWVDATYFDASLAGVKAPSPDKFPGYYLARMDSSCNGYVHPAGWRGECGACGDTGHSHSECPARKWTVNGQEYVNVRWLYEKGFCNAQGDRK